MENLFITNTLQDLLLEYFQSNSMEKSIFVSRRPTRFLNYGRRVNNHMIPSVSKRTDLSIVNQKNGASTFWKTDESI